MTDKWDAWLAPGTCGVKLAQFEQLSKQMTQAAPQLESLAHQLWQSLHGAGVDTAPAMEILRIARWAAQSGTDLRRRNELVHNLDRQKLLKHLALAGHTYLQLPDHYTDQIAYADARGMADLLLRAGDGDTKALEELARFDPAGITPMFAKTLLETLGPDGLVRLPISLVKHLRITINKHSGDLDTQARNTRAALKLLNQSLAKSIRPDSLDGPRSDQEPYVSDDYLAQLRQAARANFPPNGAPPSGVTGYQALATIMAADPTALYPLQFFKVVGQDMIAFDRSIRKYFPGTPPHDLSGTDELGNALDPTTTKATPGVRHTDILNPLLTLAANTPQGAQALLAQNPESKDSLLRYLLHDRRPLWTHTDQGASLGKALKTATQPHTPTSTHLLFVAGKILATDVPKFFKVNGERRLTISEQGELDALSGMRIYLADALGAHMGAINDVHRTMRGGSPASPQPMTEVELDLLLLDVTRDSAAYGRLLDAQIAHSRVRIDRAIATRDPHLNSVVVDEALMFGHLLEARGQTFLAENHRVEKVNEAIKQKIAMGIGLIPVVGGEHAAKYGGLGTGAFDLAVDRTRNSLVNWLAKQAATHPNKSVGTPKTNTEAIERLFNQMILSSIIADRGYDPKTIAGESFATGGHPPHVKPLGSLTPKEYGDLLRWAGDELGLGERQQKASAAIESGMLETIGHYRSAGGEFNVLPSFAR